MTSIAGLMTWFGICVTYVRFHKGFKQQGFDRSQLPYASKLQPYAAWYGIVACFVVCLVRAILPSIHFMILIIRRYTVLWLASLPQRPVGHGHLRHKLHPLHPLPYPLRRSSSVDPRWPEKGT